eukprot:CAMPEP_0182429986 /NCGR_PEP_ID=MMETSP1167-20130531/35687_1 /TAXON_ID=2988 /ORGANISM="Mallomonas Sp, Strain CCMP3275" /LENGTH=271 /DNA_ID=CAMNT_0024614471 /DNA_START=42 /DNA_END=858 /DNA_ORIENTATION=+
MGVNWSVLDEDFRAVLIRSLADPKVFRGNVSQHIANTIWGLGKMDADWTLIPGNQLINSFERCHEFTSQEITNIVYGLAIMDASWVSISRSGRRALLQEIMSKAISNTIQEVANLMYSIVIITYDYVAETKKAKNELLDIHHFLLMAYLNINKSETEPEPENFYQFAMYFEYVELTYPELLEEMVGAMPIVAGPSATVPSGLHSRAVEAILKTLLEASPKFSIFNEFNGLKSGVFPIDAAVYYDEKLIAFIEVDGDFHYRKIGQKKEEKTR